jgi:hypothetical protein
MMQLRLFYLALILIAIGAISIAVGSFMPAYTDQVAAERIRSGVECELGVPNKNDNFQCDSQMWHRSMDALRTYKWPLVDLGAGLLASALSILIFAKWAGPRLLRELVTPKRRWLLVALVAFAWLMQIPAYSLYFIAEVSLRDCCPWWADSVGLPLMQTQQVVLILFVPYVALWLVFIVGSRLPVPVFLTVPGRPFVNIIWTGAALFLGVPLTLYLINTIIDGPIVMVPFLWLTLWLVLCARSAALSRHRPKAEFSQP